MNRYYLTLSTWAELVPFASHYYGRITYKEDGVRKEVDVGEGGKSLRYANKKNLMRAAKRWFQKNTDAGSFMTLGSSSMLDPQKIIAGPEELTKTANRIWQDFEKLNGWDAPKDKWHEVQNLCNQWDQVLQNHLSSRA